MAASLIYPVIMAGGKGERLWPLSRKQYPKQVLSLLNSQSLLQHTVERVQDAASFAPPLIICDNDSRFIVRQQLEGQLINNIIIEPIGRNTAAAAAIAAIYLLEQDPEALMLLLPADHNIGNNQAFLDAVSHVKEIASEGKLVTFGVLPDRPETGYGYIRHGHAYTPGKQAFIVDSFKEKPDSITASQYVASQEYLWNSGIFLVSAMRYLTELEQFSPDTLSHAKRALDGAEEDLGFICLDKKSFSSCPSISIDYAVIEKTSHAVVMPVDMEWNDVGAWNSLLALAGKDHSGNACIGDVVAIGCKDNYLRSEGKLLAAIGLENMVVVSTSDALLVAPLDKAQEVRQLTQELAKAGRKEADDHMTVFRPWGSYTTLVEQPGFQVKRLKVRQGGKLSLQSHYHRSEHWIVVKGTAKVTCDDKSFLLHENESTYISTGQKHRLENPGKIELELIEVQSGSYFGEDDIIRYDDVYGREKEYC